MQASKPFLNIERRLLARPVWSDWSRLCAHGRMHARAAQNCPVRISAKADYAVRATIVLAGANSGGPVTAESIALAQEIPLKFLLNILSELKRGRIVASHRGTHGGFQLARPAAE